MPFCAVSERVAIVEFAQDVVLLSERERAFVLDNRATFDGRQPKPCSYLVGQHAARLAQPLAHVLVAWRCEACGYLHLNAFFFFFCKTSLKTRCYLRTQDVVTDEPTTSNAKSRSESDGQSSTPIAHIANRQPKTSSTTGQPRL